MSLIHFFIVSINLKINKNKPPYHVKSDKVALSFWVLYKNKIPIAMINTMIPMK